QISVLRVFHNTDDGPIRNSIKTDVLSDDVDSSEEMLHHVFVDDDDLRGAYAIVFVEVTTGHKWDFECLEIISRNPGCVTRHRFAFLRCVAFNHNPELVPTAGDWRVGCETCR